MIPQHLLIVVLAFLIVVPDASAQPPQVVVETIQPGVGPAVTTDYMYNSHVTLYLDDGMKTPSGWSTRQEHGATSDAPFTFQPGRNLIAGWTTGVLQMKEGERAMLHVPAALGYGSKPMGSPQGAFYIPANSDLLFDIEIIGKFSEPEM
jgi:FKBP-type peptidyl-prolyl cis-trans isomerase